MSPQLEYTEGGHRTKVRQLRRRDIPDRKKLNNPMRRHAPRYQFRLTPLQALPHSTTCEWSHYRLRTNKIAPGMEKTAGAGTTANSNCPRWRIATYKSTKKGSTFVTTTSHATTGGNRSDSAENQTGGTAGAFTNLLQSLLQRVTRSAQ